MGIPHQAINCKRIFILSLFIFTLLAPFLKAQAYDSLFVVEGVEVDVTAKNSVAAQKQAFSKAQHKAFRILAERMVEETQVENVATADSGTIASLVKDYEVTNEQLSSVRYVGTYTFRFREAAVSKFFSVSGVTFTDRSSKPLLVLPIFQKDGKNTIWSEDNVWMRAWGRADLNSGIVPVEVPIGDLMDIADIDDNNALSYERKKLDRMLLRYGASEAAIMIAVPDMTLLSVPSAQEQAAGRLRISIYRTDRGKAEHVQDVIVTPQDGESRAALYDRAVQNAYSVLQEDWKSKTSIESDQKNTFHVRTAFDDMQGWMTRRSALNKVPGVADVTILSLSPNQARLSFVFHGDEARLRSMLAMANMGIRAVQDNPASHNFTENARRAPPVIYDLVYGQDVKPAYKAGTGEQKPGQHTF